MIQIRLGLEPQILIDNALEWGAEYTEALQNGVENPPERYRRDDIRDALKCETRAKCAYCESKCEHVTYSHIEHIVPKSRVPQLVCTWSNLTLACPVCNNSKRGYHDVPAPLLNPYVDDVEAEITFYGPMALERTDRGMLSIVKLKLNRSALLFERCEKLQEILKIMQLIVASGSNRVVKNALVTELRDKAADDAEYASCVRCFVSDEGPQLDLEGI